MQRVPALTSINRRTALPRGVVRALWSDPAYASERIVMIAVTEQLDEARRYAVAARDAEPDAGTAALCESERLRVLRLSRIDGAIAGTPFFIALVPAYVAFLWEQVRMTLRIAALNGRDLAATDMAAELLWLRGVHPSIADAHGALARLGQQRPKRLEHGWREVYGIGRQLLVLIGLIGPPKPVDETVPRWRRDTLMALCLAAGAATWVLTWFFPVTLMMLIAYSCDGSTRQLAARGIEHFGRGGHTLPSTARWQRPRLMIVVLTITVLIPVVLIALAVSHQEQIVGTRRLLVGLLGLAVVLATSGAIRVRARR